MRKTDPARAYDSSYFCVDIPFNFPIQGCQMVLFLSVALRHSQSVMVVERHHYEPPRH